MQKTILSVIVAMAAITAGMQFFTNMSQQTERFLQKDLLLETSWAQFKYTFEKSYATAAEEAFRKSVFAEAHAFVQKHNANPKKSYTVAINHMADLSRDEFRTQKLRPKNMQPKTLKARKYVGAPANYVANADGKDWRRDGAVNTVRDQAQCGSCWAFGAIAAAEGAYYVKHGSLPEYSEQALVDCVVADYGCNGGLQEDAYDWLERNDFVARNLYPYTARDGTCEEDIVSTTGERVASYSFVTPDSAEAVQAALDHSPITISIEADNWGFQLYSSGYFNDESCGTSLDHAVALVGYGSDSGRPYFILRNSWGTSWGDAGYMLIAMESTTSRHGICGCLSEPITVDME